MAKSAHDLLLSLWKLLPHYIVFFRVMTRLTLLREPMLAAADCINFEDMIGRKFMLRFHDYKHWPNFEAFLGQQFRDGPGKKHVREQQYHLMREDDIVSEKEWSLAMEPGIEIAMSGLLLAWTTTGRKCPRPSCFGDGKKCGKTSFFECATCNLIYAPGISGPRSLVEEASEVLGEVDLRVPASDDDRDEKYFKKIHVTWEGPEDSTTAPAPAITNGPNVSTSEAVLEQWFDQSGSLSKKTTEPAFSQSRPTRHDSGTSGRAHEETTMVDRALEAFLNASPEASARFVDVQDFDLSPIEGDRHMPPLPRRGSRRSGFQTDLPENSQSVRHSQHSSLEAHTEEVSASGSEVSQIFSRLNIIKHGPTEASHWRHQEERRRKAMPFAEIPELLQAA